MNYIKSTEFIMNSTNLSVKKLIPTLTLGLTRALKTPFIVVDTVEAAPLLIDYEYQFNNGIFVYVKKTQTKVDAFITIPINPNLICNCDKNLLYGMLKDKLQSRFSYNMEIYPITGNSRIGIHIKANYDCI